LNTIDPDAPIGPDHMRPARGGLRLRIAATAALVVLSALSAARLASASFDEASVPVGEVATLDGIVSGTIRIAGGRFSLYSGDRLQSTNQNLAVSFANGGSLVLCPHSQVQILAANESSRIMLAFEQGGTEQPFQLHTGDVVMTPDWRIELRGNAHKGDFGTLQVSTSRSGVLCLSGNVQNGATFRVSQLVGDSVFDVTGQSSIKIAGAHIVNSPGGCACEGSPSGAVAMPAPVATLTSVAGAAPAAAPAAMPLTAPSSNRSAPSAAVQSNALSAANLAPSGKKKQHPQDVAGYVHSFIHLVFGR
jgi:hypothetical protein